MSFRRVPRDRRIGAAPEDVVAAGGHRHLGRGTGGDGRRVCDAESRGGCAIFPFCAGLARISHQAASGMTKGSLFFSALIGSMVRVCG